MFKYKGLTKVVNFFCSLKKQYMRDIILDVDGVLILSTKIGINSLITAIQSCNLNMPSVNQIKCLWGHHLETELLPALAKELKWPKNSELNVLESFYEVTLKIKYPKQENLSSQLRAISKRCKLGIATNRDLDSLIFRLEQHEIDPGIFSHIQTAGSSISKPDPRFFDSFWNGAGFKPERVVFIGDSITYDLGVAKAHQPELRFAAITSGMHSFGEFLKAGVKCQYIFQTTEQALNAQYLFL